MKWSYLIHALLFASEAGKYAASEAWNKIPAQCFAVVPDDALWITAYTGRLDDLPLMSLRFFPTDQGVFLAPQKLTAGQRAVFVPWNTLVKRKQTGWFSKGMVEVSMRVESHRIIFETLETCLVPGE